MSRYRRNWATVAGGAEARGQISPLGNGTDGVQADPDRRAFKEADSARQVAYSADYNP
jgi:hypothetical protein